MTFAESLLLFLKNYWKIIFLIIYPLILLPIFLVENNRQNRCIYVITLMGGFWVFEIIPLALTGLIPVAFFPLMGILPTKQTSSCYITETTALFTGSYLLALAVQESNLHMRISLNILKLIGFSPKKLHLLFTCVTLFISIWISSIPSTAFVIPILHTTLTELEGRAVGKMYREGSVEEDEADVYEDKRLPTHSTMGYFISIAYASIIGSTGFFTGDLSNAKFTKIYKSTTSKEINSGMWFLYSIPYMVITAALTIVWIQILFMGLFRPNSTDAQDLQGVPDEEKASANDELLEKLQTMGPMTFHEIAVSISVVLAVLLWIFREPIFMPGWMHHLSIQPASVAVLIIMLIFLIPRLPICCNVFSSDEEKIPQNISPGLLLWKFVVRKVPWVLIFLIGGGEAIAEGAKHSGLSFDISYGLGIFKSHSYFGMTSLLPLIAISMTQLTNSFTVCNVMMPSLAKVCQSTDIHPIYIMFPTFLSTSFGYLLPVSSPPNAMIADLINMPTVEMMKVGIVVLIISYLVLLVLTLLIQLMG